MDDSDLARARVVLAGAIERRLGPFNPLHLDAVRTVPRERFVRAEDADRAVDDTPLPLDDEGLATISAPHAYLLTFRLLALAPGDVLLELGAGSGYGAALAAFVVGPRGRVVSLEIDPALASLARKNVAALRTVRVLDGDAEDAGPHIERASKVACTFAVTRVPEAWLAALGEGAVLVAPVGPHCKDQRLVRHFRHGGRVVKSDHGSVRYVPNRSHAAAR